MCGIIGYQALNFRKESVAQALSFVMNRGYDSIGIQINNNIKKKVFPNKDNINEVIKSFEHSGFENCIAHTRWATHGNIDELHAHPIRVGNCSVVMNGQIKNYDEISKKCDNLQTKCDTELLPYLINQEILKFEFETNSEISKNHLIEIIKNVTNTLKGDFTFALKFENLIVLFKRGNPLHIGFSTNSIVFSSDYRACFILDKEIKQSYSLEDEEIIILRDSTLKNCIGINNNRIKIITNCFKLDEYSNKENNYASSIYNTYNEIINQGNFKSMNKDKNTLFISNIRKELDNIMCLGEGSSYHLALNFEEQFNLRKKENENNYSYQKIAFTSSELDEYKSKSFKDKSLLLYSQSGETKDLIDILKKYKFKKVFIITNNEFSTLASLSNEIFTINCGIEYGVAATISFTNSLFVNYCIFNSIKLNDNLNCNKKILDNLNNNESEISKLTSLTNLSNIKTGFFLSKQINSFNLESCLKLSELSEILFMPNNFNSLKHGMYSCIEEYNTIVILDNDASSNLIHQLLSRKAIIITINSKLNNPNIINLNLKNCDTEFEKLFLKTIIIQKIAYEIAISKNLNPDKPKNLAKSVTVES